MKKTKKINVVKSFDEYEKVYFPKEYEQRLNDSLFQSGKLGEKLADETLEIIKRCLEKN